jgi:hypothetical protein
MVTRQPRFLQLLEEFATRDRQRVAEAIAKHMDGAVDLAGEV